MRKIYVSGTRRIRQVLYYAAIILLIAASIYQVYSIRSNQSDTIAESGSMAVITGVRSSLLTPDTMLLAKESGYVKVEATSGYYPELCQQSQKFIELIVKNQVEAQEILKEKLPEQEGILILQYAYRMEKMAVQELLMQEMKEDCQFREIWIQPALSQQERAGIYLIDWENEQYVKISSTISWKDAVNQNFCSAFFGAADALDTQYWAAWKSFPDHFQGGIYYLQQEAEMIVYEASLKSCYGTETGYNRSAAEEYVMHFFPYPDTAKSISEDYGIVWYADEKRTVRLEQDGFLQYVQTVDNTETISVSLTEAYQMATAFLEEDLLKDTNRLMEVYLCEYEVQDDVYTFYWNYKLDNIPLWMDPERQENWDMPYPVKITVENGEVRYFHRYLVEKVMQPDRLYTVPVSYLEALDLCQRLYEAEGTVQEMELGYEEQGNVLQLCWKIRMNHQWYMVPVKGGIL